MSDVSTPHGTFRVGHLSRRAGLIVVRGPLEYKKPHRGVYSTEYGDWLTHTGVAGGDGHNGPRVHRFYAGANIALREVYPDV